MRALALSLLLLSPLVHADARSRAAEAKKLVGTVLEAPDLQMQGKLALASLAEPTLELPAPVVRYLKAVQEADYADQWSLLAGALDKLGHDYLHEACGTSSLNEALGSPTAPLSAMMTRCHVVPGKNAPMVITATMGAPAVLFGAYLADLLTKRGSSADELTLARFVGHVGRSDAAKMKPLKKP